MNQNRDRIREGWQEWLASNHRGWRIVVGFVCVIFLALFLHFREVRLEVLELNATAGRYIVAQVDFEFPDYETTIVLKQQAMQDVGKIYQIEDKQIREARYSLEETLIHNKNWRSSAPQSTFEEMYKAADELETLLLEARFTDPRTIQKIRELDLPDISYFDFLPPEEGPANLPLEFWNRISQQISQIDAFHPDSVNYVIRSFQQRDWNLVDDVALRSEEHTSELQ